MDDIWDDANIIPRSPTRVSPPSAPDYASSSSSPAPAASLRRPGPDAASTSKSKASGRAALTELDDIFADIDDLDDARPTKKARRSGRESTKGKKNVLLSDDEDEVRPPGTTKGKEKKDDSSDDEKKKKPRAKPVKLDENRLLGPNGLKALVDQHRKFKPSGKGNEVKDLKRLLELYQFWAVKLYPRGDFRETIEKVEKLCHTKRMHNALNSLKRDLADGAAGPVGYEVEPDPNEPNQGSDDDDSAMQTHPSSAPIRPPNFSQPSDDSDDDLPIIRTRPSTSMSGLATSGTSDLDDLIAEDMAERRSALAANNKTTSATAPKPKPVPATAKSKTVGGAAMDDDWDLDALLAEEETMNGLSINATSSVSKGGLPLEPDEFDDEYGADIGMDMDLDIDIDVSSAARAAKSNPTSTTAKTTTVTADDDEEMWDMIASMHPE